LAMFSFVIGTALGALVGFAAGLRWVVTHESEPWKPGIWRGVGRGLVLGVVLQVICRFVRPSTLTDNMSYAPIAVMLTAALGMLGGVAAKLLGSRRDRRDGPRP